MDVFERQSRSGPMLAFGTLLFIDVLRVWLPSTVTIFGQAGSTPPAHLGGFALLWFVLPFAVVWLWDDWLSDWPRRLLMNGSAVGLAGCRAALLLVHGGQPQLYIASAGVLCGLIWLVVQAMDGAAPVPGVPAGIVLAAAGHLALGTVDLTWTGTWWAVVIVALELLVFLVFAIRRPWDVGTLSTGWSTAGPVMFLASVVVLSPAAMMVEVSYLAGAPGDDLAGPGIGVSVSAWLGLLFVLPVVAFWRGMIRLSNFMPGLIITFGVLLVVCVAVYMYVPVHGYGPIFRLAAIGFGAWALGRCLSVTWQGETYRPVLTGLSTLGGMLLFAVATVVYYAAYDLGYPNRWVPVVVAGYVALRACAVAGRGEIVDERDMRWSYVVLSTLMTGLFGLIGLGPTPPERPELRSVRLVAYNIRMGFGLDGTFDPSAAAAAVRQQHPDVVVLSEVDRAWLLNGGHDTLAILARKLGMRYTFAPAADPVWGDAVLTNLPVTGRSSVRLSADGAPTGAQALGVIVRAGNREIAVVSTHIQPPAGRAPLTQVRQISDFANRFGGDRPTIVAGDLNIEPGDESMDAFAGSGFADALARFRPLPTFPADHPTRQIDHVLVRGGLTASEPVVGSSAASDHAPLAVTLTW
ncbi:endonuclease/exonuclease/phosphatase family protein [Dactylosporangium cerinum]|uniref:Endonuclease/exonuclease/phosphatase family protein n=1 Tax=Dactylosporangium cerinum TaxID=1434730 RepID=A0ABV9W535_9ACTN